MRDKEAVTAGRGALTTLVVLVALAGIAATVTLPFAGITDHPLALLTLLALSAWVGSHAIHIPRLKIDVTAGDAFMFCGMLAVGALAAPVIAVTGILGAAVGGERRMKPLRAVFNVSVVGLAAALAARAYTAVTTGPLQGASTEGIGLLLSAAVFILVNTVLVALALRLERGEPFFAVWRSFAGCAGSSTITSMLVGLGLHSLYLTLGLIGLFTGLAGSAVLGSAAQAFRDRMNHETASSPSS